MSEEAKAAVSPGDRPRRPFPWYRLPLYGAVYRATMKLSHHFGWHYAPLKPVEGGWSQRWCQWCGFRQSIRDYGPEIAAELAAKRASATDNG